MMKKSIFSWKVAFMTSFTPFRTDFAPRDEDIAARLLLTATLSPEVEKRVDQSAKGMIHAIRTKTSGLGGVEELLREYSLSTPEGLALMVLAEALLRVPDAETAIALTADQLGRADFDAEGDGVLARLSSSAIALSKKFLPEAQAQPGLLSRLGARSVVAATVRALAQEP